MGWTVEAAAVGINLEPHNISGEGGRVGVLDERGEGKAIVAHVDGNDAASKPLGRGWEGGGTGVLDHAVTLTSPRYFKTHTLHRGNLPLRSCSVSRYASWTSVEFGVGSSQWRLYRCSLDSCRRP